MSLSRPSFKLVAMGVFFLVLAGEAWSGAASPGTWTAYGPDGGFVTAIAGHPDDPGTLLVGTGQGIYKSTDQGETWLSHGSGLVFPQIASIAIHPITSTIVFVGDYYGGIYKSTDGGAHWTSPYLGDPPYFTQHDPVFAIAFDPDNSETIYAGTYVQPRKSTDGGSTWDDIRPVPHNFYALAVHPLTPTTLYLGSNSGLYLSQDGGANWVNEAVGLSTPVLALAIHPITPSVMFAGSPFGVYRSVDGGANWVAVNNGLDYTDIRWLAMDPVDPDVVYAAPLTPFGPASLAANVFRTVDGGEQWTATPTGYGNPGVYSLVVLSDTVGTVVAGTWGGGVFQSADHGETWSRSAQGMLNGGILSVAIAPFNSQRLYVGTEGAGVFKSDDAGVTWEPASSGITTTQIYGLAFDPAITTTVYAAGNDGFFRSLDDGASWTVHNTGLDPYEFNQPFPLGPVVVHPTIPGLLYLGANTGVYTSTNGGLNWTRASAGMLPTPEITALLFDPTTPATLYAGGEAAVYKSLNGGLTWSDISSGLGWPRLTSLVMHPTDPQTLYAGTYTGGVYKTTNGGNDWVSINTGLPAAQGGERHITGLAIGSLPPHTLYAALRDIESPDNSEWAGVYASWNGGVSWGPLGRGLTVTHMSVLGLHPAAPHRLYAGTIGGSLTVLDLPRLFLPLLRR